MYWVAGLLAWLKDNPGAVCKQRPAAPAEA